MFVLRYVYGRRADPNESRRTRHETEKRIPKTNQWNLITHSECYYLFHCIPITTAVHCCCCCTAWCTTLLCTRFRCNSLYANRQEALTTTTAVCTAEYYTAVAAVQEYLQIRAASRHEYDTAVLLIIHTHTAVRFMSHRLFHYSGTLML